MQTKQAPFRRVSEWNVRRVALVAWKVPMLVLFGRAVFGAALAVAVSSCANSTAVPAMGDASGPAASMPRAVSPVKIVSEAYWPKTLKIAAGTTVRWSNRDPLTHTVTANDGSFSSPFLYKGHAWSRVFRKPGTYAYHCKIHSFMTGTVIVTN